MDMDQGVKLDYYPTPQDIINCVEPTKCDECGKNFQNSSACRFHQLKQHFNIDVSTNEYRLIRKNCPQAKVTLAFHCPDPLCKSSRSWFDGLRNIRQHYMRAHAEKNLKCEDCPFRTALEKDLNYHKKTRCPKSKMSIEAKAKRKAAKKLAGPQKRGTRCDKGYTNAEWAEEKEMRKYQEEKKKKSKRKRSEESSSSEEEEEDDEDEDEEEERVSKSKSAAAKRRKASSKPSTSSPTATKVVQPIFFIVNSDNVGQVVSTIQKGLINPADISLNDIGRDLHEANIPYLETSETIPVPVTSTSFATQYEEPTTFCERGTMMNGQALDFFDPPFGAEFGDITPGGASKSQQETFDYPNGPSTSEQPQTRSFGTMFGVPTCHAGTSTIDENYVSDFLRDIETQTNFIPPTDQSSSSSQQQSSDDWPSSWHMTDGGI